MLKLNQTNKILSLFVLILLFSFSCRNEGTSNQSTSSSETEANKTEEATAKNLEPVTPTITKVWETDSVFTTCESVNYDAKNGLFLVSNIKGNPSVKDGNGTIATLDQESNMLDGNFLTGLDAPKGMAIVDDKLYVTDIDALKIFSITDRKLIMIIRVENAKFLNDVDASADGTVYFSDSGADKIYKVLDDKSYELVYETKDKGINGLFVEGNDLLFATFQSGEFKRLNLASKEVSLITDGIEAGDGIVKTKKGNYIVSSWKGKIFHITPEGERTILLDTEEKYQTADIWYDENSNYLMIPTFFRNTVVAYEVNE